MQPEGSIPSVAPAAPPAMPSTAAPSPSSASAPSPGSQPAPSAPAPDGGAAVSTPGAQPHPQSAVSLAEERYNAARSKYHETRAKMNGDSADRGAEAEPLAAAPQEPKAPIEAQTDPPPAEPPAPAEAASDVDFDDPETVITEEQFRQHFRTPAKLSKTLAAREAQRAEAVKGVSDIGGEEGLRFSREFNQLVFKPDPDEKDAEAAFDALVLSNKGGARKLVSKMANHFVSSAIYDPNEGPGFVSSLIQGEWGTQPDGKTSYDLPFVDSFMKAHKSWGLMPDGKPVSVETIDALVKAIKKHGVAPERALSLIKARGVGILPNDEYIDAELADHPDEPEHVPSEREKQLAAEVEQLKAKSATDEQTAEQKEAEAKAAQAERFGIYRTQAKNWVTKYVQTDALKAAIDAGWAVPEGQEGAPSQKRFGKMIANEINSEIEHGATKEAYAQAMKMIDDGEAFTRDGQPTARFLHNVKPLKIAAKALHNELLRELGPAVKFAASTSRNAKLVTENGRNGQRSASDPPALATPRPAQGEESYEDGKRRIRERFNAQTRADQARPGTLR